MQSLVILFIVTSHALLGNSNEATGLWLEEFTTPYYAFIDAGYEVEIVSIKGGEVPVDPRSTQEAGENPVSVERFLKDRQAMEALKYTQPIDTVKTDKYAAVFLPGGHGTMWDLPDNKKLAKIISDTLADNRVVAAVCHGPAGLVSAVDDKGEPVVKNRKIAAFTNAEEKAAGLTDAVPFLLETRLRELGANFHKGPEFKSFAVSDNNLITGQNPASSEAVAKLVIQHLRQNKPFEK